MTCWCCTEFGAVCVTCWKPVDRLGRPTCECNPSSTRLCPYCQQTPGGKPGTHAGRVLLPSDPEPPG